MYDVGTHVVGWLVMLHAGGRRRWAPRHYLSWKEEEEEES